MDNIFGLSMTTILIVTLGIMGLCLLTTAIIALRNRVIFKMALRNIPRRKAQTILIVIGLMLSTVIIAASLTTGDTIDYSITRATYEGLGHTDETISYVGGTDSEGQISVNNQPIPASIAADLEATLGDDPDIDGIMPVLTASVPVVNVTERLSEPSVILTGVDPERIGDFGGLKTPEGAQIDFAAATGQTAPLPANIVEQLQALGVTTGLDGQPLDLEGIMTRSVIISEDLADEVSASEGDLLVFFYQNVPYPITVGAIAEGSLLTGYDATFGSSDLMGVSVPLSFVEEVTGLTGQARYIAVSNTGQIDNSIGRTDAVVDKLEGALASVEGGNELGVNPAKKDAVDGAASFGAVFMSFFIVLGLFSVAAGILLIFLIFMMLAAERRSEMGMARAVGMKRSHLVQNFIAEGTAYDLGAALVGAAIGVLVAFAIAGVMGQLIGEFFTIRPHATFRSLLVAYSLGVAVTFLTIIFASVRASRLNIVAAIRDLPDESSPHTHERPHWRWWSRLPRFAGIASTVFWFPLELIWNVVLIPLKLAVWLLRLLAHYVGWGPFLTFLGALMMLGGTSAKSVFQFSVGLTLGSVGLAIFLARYLPKRLVYTIIAAINLAYYLVPFETLEFILPDLGTGGFEMFFVSGISMVTFATLIIMWNAEVVIAAISFIGRISSRWLPAVKTAVAYPMAARGRTGMTVAMFSLVIFSLVALSTINANFAESAQTDAADAGWDISLGTSPSNPIDDLRAELAGSEVDVSQIAAVGRISGLSYENTRLRNLDEDEGEWKFYGTNSLDSAYVTEGELLLEARAPGFESDEAVWDAFRAGEPVAIVDAFAFDDDAFGNDPDGWMAPKEADIVDGTIPAVEIEILNQQTGQPERLTVIGVIDSKISTLFGLYIPEQYFNELYSGPDFTALNVRLVNHESPAAEELAKQMESALLTRGVEAESIQALLDEQMSIQNGFLRLLQGFMGLGLVVGIAALGVISFRSVVERRQQIGMLRAIGYQKNMVALSFLLESLVIAAIGVLSGTILAVILSYNLVNSEDFQEGADFVGFVVPWGTILAFVAASLVAAAIMTWVPARKASSVPIADALRYE